MGLLDDRQRGLLAMQHNIDPRYKAASRAPAAQVLRGLLAPQQLAEMALAFAPGSGDAMAVRDGQQNFADMRKSIEGGDYGKAASDAIYGTTAYASALPVLGAAIPHFGGMVKAVRGAGKAADLPMDEASRMARADEHFPIDAFHGTAGDDFSAFADRRGGGSMPVDGATWFAATSGPANDIAASRMKSAGQNSGRVIPVRLRMENPLVVDAEGKHAVDVLGVKDAAARGYDGVILKNVREFGSNNLTTSYAVFDPKNIRSRFAKFDPKNRNSRDLLAGVAGAGLLAAPVARGMLADDQQPY